VGILARRPGIIPSRLIEFIGGRAAATCGDTGLGATAAFSPGSAAQELHALAHDAEF
jgi:hypothetical protein